ncbi:MAG: methyltransferase domain-containing protein [Bacteroidota bacterium]|nr:methyltransferase domain-containing protein [Bacteroidota bacterium]
MKFDNLLRYAVRIIDAYSGEKPLHIWLKEFFRANPQMGSRDRKLVSEMVYCFYRLGHSLKNIPVHERILSGLFLCNETPMEALQYLIPEWNEAIDRTLEDKIRLLQEKYPDFSIEQIFPWQNLLSEGIDHRQFCLSFLKKPDLFIRVRAGKEQTVSEKLGKGKLVFREQDPGEGLLFKSYSFFNGTRLEDVIDLNRDAVVQDLSSQKTGRLMCIPDLDPEKIIRAWDCCAASGGKSILLADLYPTLDLTVSDIRKSILENLRIRFVQAGISRYQALMMDLTLEKDLPKQSFDLIVADLPCTGSGTWSRTPESLYFFDPQKVESYRDRQQQMLSNIIRCLKPGATLVYITCSVFAAENEQILERMLEDGSFQRTGQEMITGYRERADSLFAGRFKKRFV